MRTPLSDTRAADIEVVDVDGGARMLELVGDDAGLFELSSDQTQLFLRAGQVCWILRAAIPN